MAGVGGLTRVNLVPPQELSDQHLMAEYREIPMVPASLRRTIASRRGFDPNRIPPAYTLNAGHVMFFYDKGGWLRRRYGALVCELLWRGIRVDPGARSVAWDVFQVDQPWQPTEVEVEVSRSRIKERLALKPFWYRWSHRALPYYAVDLRFEVL